MLIANGLVKNYGALPVVRDVSLQVIQGEMVSIIGPSGAGKSTLLHLLGALDKPDSGTVTINGTDLFRLSGRTQATFRNKHLGFVFQFHHLLPEFTAIENVAMPMWIARIGRQEALKKAAALLDQVGMMHRQDNKPGQLSGGEQQRVAIARALIMQPSIVMLDEPTGNLDSQNAHAVHDLLLQLCRDRGQTFVMITHNETLASMTDRTLVMRDGTIVEQRENQRISAS